jgi:hypothetical protein
VIAGLEAVVEKDETEGRGDRVSKARRRERAGSPAEILVRVAREAIVRRRRKRSRIRIGSRRRNQGLGSSNCYGENRI